MNRTRAIFAVLAAGTVLLAGCAQGSAKVQEVKKVITPQTSSAPAKLSGKPLTVLAMGDSTTAGTPDFLSPVEAPPEGKGDPESQYAHWIRQRHPEWTVLNRGVNGERTDEICRRLEKDLSRFKADVVVVLAGVNDLYQGRSVDEIWENLKKIYALAEAKNLRIMACTVLPYNTSTQSIRHRMMELNQRIRGEVLLKNYLFCNTYELLNDPSHAGMLAGTPDGLHPDVAGYRRMGEAITDVLEKAFA